MKIVTFLALICCTFNLNFLCFSNIIVTLIERINEKLKKLENKQVKVGFQMIAAISVFDLPPNLSINPITKQFLLMGIPACNRPHLKFP